MSDIEKYRQYFTKDYLMGPNSFRLLDELIRRKPSDVRFHRTLDLGCGFALTSLFIANETDADAVYAYDLWIPATENYRRIRDNHLEDRVIPIHGDAMDQGRRVCRKDPAVCKIGRLCDDRRSGIKGKARGQS